MQKETGADGEKTSQSARRRRHKKEKEEREAAEAAEKEALPKADDDAEGEPVKQVEHKVDDAEILLPETSKLPDIDELRASEC